MSPPPAAAEADPMTKEEAPGYRTPLSPDEPYPPPPPIPWCWEKAEVREEEDVDMDAGEEKSVVDDEEAEAAEGGGANSLSCTREMSTFGGVCSSSSASPLTPGSGVPSRELRAEEGVAARGSPPPPGVDDEVLVAAAAAAAPCGEAPEAELCTELLLRAGPLG